MTVPQLRPQEQQNTWTVQLGWLKQFTEMKHEPSIYRMYWGADKSLGRPGRKQAQKHVRDAREFNNSETRAVIKVSFFCKARRRSKYISVCPSRAKDLSAPQYMATVTA